MENLSEATPLIDTDRDFRGVSCADIRLERKATQRQIRNHYIVVEAALLYMMLLAPVNNDYK